MEAETDCRLPCQYSICGCCPCTAMSEQVWHRGAEFYLILLDLVLWRIRPPILTDSNSGMLAELAFSVPDFSKSKLSTSSKAGPRGFVPPALSFLCIPERNVCLRTGKTATLTCKISVCLFSSALLSSVQVLGLTQGILPSQAVWERLAVVYEGWGGGKKGCYFCRTVNPAPFASAAFFFLWLVSKKLLLQQHWLQTKSHLLKVHDRTGRAFCTFVGHL